MKRMNDGLKQIVWQIALKTIKPGMVVECLSSQWSRDIKLGERLIVSNVDELWVRFNGIHNGYNPSFFKIIEE